MDQVRERVLAKAIRVALEMKKVVSGNILGNMRYVREMVEWRTEIDCNSEEKMRKNEERERV